MSAIKTHWFLSSFIVAVVLSSTVWAEDGARQPCSCPQSAQTTLSFQPGDTLQIASPSAKLMLGTELLGTLPQGEHIVVVETRGSWVGTRVLIQGQTKAGWIRSGDFAPASRVASAARRTPATFTANPQTPAETQAAQPPVYGVGSPTYQSGNGYSGGYYFGYPTSSYEVYGRYHP